MLITATSLTINLHYCEGQLYDFALIVPTHDCCEDVAHKNHCNHEGEMDNSNHCDDKTINFESTSEFVATDISFSFENTHSFDLFFTTRLFINDQSTSESTTTTLLNLKKPPNPQEVVLSQIQSFLI
jgi:hypothetical protein